MSHFLRGTMKKFALSVLLSVSLVVAAVISPSQSTIAILLDQSGLCDSSSVSWKNMQVNEFLKNNAFYGKDAPVYCKSYSNSMSPAEAADSLFRGKNSVFEEALKKYSKNASDSGSKIVRNKFLIIAEGAAGLAVREYIQSKDYKGEIENVLFFNTPHEGTGFADQLLLNGAEVLTKKAKSFSDYSDLIPFALAIYLVGKTDNLADLMMELLKEAVFGMAMDAGDVAKQMSDYFKDRDKSYESLLYLAQDMNLNDEAYKSVFENAKDKGYDLNQYVGSIQLLNSYSTLNSFDHPAYNNVYSFGLPSIGNGRRTLYDFADQQKNHVSKEKMEQLFKDAIFEKLEGLPDFEKEKINNMVSEVLRKDPSLSASAFTKALSTKFSEYNLPIAAITEITDCLQDVSKLHNLKFNKENFSNSIMQVISIANKYLPEKYKSELFSTFIEEYSETVVELKEKAEALKEDYRSGVKLIQNNLSNYALNFFDEGTFDVPAFSAIGKNVQAFKDINVPRFGYSLLDYIEQEKDNYSEAQEFVQNGKNQLEELKHYVAFVSDAGHLENIRKDVDLGLKIGCGIVEKLNPAAGKACRAGQFVTNVALIAKGTSYIREAIKRVENLKSVKYAAIEMAMAKKGYYTQWKNHKNESDSTATSDMERMLFGIPLVSLQTVRKKGEVIDSIVPLVLFKKFKQVKENSDILNIPDSYGFLLPSTKFRKVDRNKLTDDNSVMLKDVQEVATYSPLGTFIVRDFIEEYRFVIDDFQPDELRLIQFDFNARKQIAYERKGNLWYVYRGTDNKWEENPVDTLWESPVQKDGQFIFRPADVLSKGNDSLLLSSIQEDGANSVGIYVVNKVGYANNQTMKFQFQAVDYLVEEGWPKSFETVSRMDTVDFYANDLGYGGIVNKYSLIVKGLNYSDTVSVFVDSLEGPGSRFKFWTDLTPIWKKHPIEETTYTLKWNLGFTTKILNSDNSVGEQKIAYSPQTIVYVDTTAPSMKFDDALSPNIISSRINEIAYVIAEDSVADRSICSIRCFISKNGGNEKIELLNKGFSNERYYKIEWKENFPTWNGKAKLVVQAYDCATPNKALNELLAEVSKDSAKNAWNYVFLDTSFVKGFNGTTLEKQILIDNEAPHIVNKKIEVLEFVNDNFPLFKKQNNEFDYVLNSTDTLLVSFDIAEELFGRKSENITIELIFKDSVNVNHVKYKRYPMHSVITDTDKQFVFKEPAVNRLADGIYSLIVEISDEVGNKNTDTLISELRVDRSKPEVKGITLGDVAFANISELGNGIAYLSQTRDDIRNRSDLICYVKVNTDAKKGSWKETDLETDSKTKENVNTIFSVKNSIDDTTHGFWYVYFGCFDDAGNFGSNMNFIGVGNRYPEITYPNNISEFYSGNVLLRGIAPNPDVHGNDNHGFFKVSWKKEGDSTWSEEGIEYLIYDRSLSATERDLVIWNTTKAKVSQGEYVLQLSVKSCDSCKWVSNERRIAMDDYRVPEEVNAPDILINRKSNSHIAGKKQDISVELKNVRDSSEWLVSIMIDASSAKDSSVYVRAFEKSFNGMRFSPYRKVPTESDSGFSIWQDSDDSTWHVRYKGNPIRLKNSRVDSLNALPVIAIRFVESDVDFGNSPRPDSTELLGFKMDSIRVHVDSVSDFIVPAYDVVKKWTIPKDSIHLTFKTVSSFIIDVSDAGFIEADSLFYKRFESPVIYVHPEKYKVHFAWDGLVSGAYPGGSLVKMHVIAYEKGNEKNIISKDAEWYLDYEDTKIEISSNNVEKYYVNFLKEMKDSSKIKMADYGFQFKISGSSAYVTATIEDSGNNIVHTMLDNELVVATHSNQWQTLNWNGVKDDGLIKAGKYNVHLLLKKNDKILIDTLYPFTLSLADNLVEASLDSSKGIPAALKMEEAYVDENGDYRYVGKADYVLRSNISMRVLPEDERSFHYQWNFVGGKQKPTLYKKTRPSLGFRRSRDEFPATVVTMVIAENRYYNGHMTGLSSVCEEIPRLSQYHYKIQAHLVYFKKGQTDESILFDFDPVSNRHNDANIYGFKQTVQFRNFSGKQLILKTDTLHTFVAIKVFPASSFDKIHKEFMGNSGYAEGNALADVGMSSFTELPWKDIYKSSIYLNDENSTHLKNWFSNYGGQALYFEAVKDGINIFGNTDTLRNQMNLSNTECKTDFINATSISASDTNFICGAKNAKEEIDTSVVNKFNPHAYMMDVTLKPFDDYKDFLDKNYNEEHCSFNGSGTNIKIKFVLDIDSNYWEPKAWGTNNLANRYVRFDPLNKTLYGKNGYLNKIQSSNFFNGTEWTKNVDLNNGPTVFEIQSLPMEKLEENPLLFNDELTEFRIFNSTVSSRFYRGSGDITYKAVLTDPYGLEIASFTTDDSALQNGEDVIIGNIPFVYGYTFYVAPMMDYASAEKAKLFLTDPSFIVDYPLSDSVCITPFIDGYRFYGSDKWVSRIHYKVNDWNMAEWKEKFTGKNGYFRNPLTDPSSLNEALTNYALKKTNQTDVHSAKVDSNTWSAEIETSKINDDFGFLHSGKYELIYKNLNDNPDNWNIVSDTSEHAVRYKFTHKGVHRYTVLDFYRAKDSIFIADTSLNNTISLKAVIAQNQKDSILNTAWAKIDSVSNVQVLKRKVVGNSLDSLHPYFTVDYNSTQKVFNVKRTFLDAYASRENEIVTLLGRTPYAVSDWNISYIQNGMRFNIVGKKNDTLDKTKQFPIIATKNVNELQGNTSFFLTYNGSDNVTYYRQLDVRIGELVKKEDTTNVSSMYGNVSVQFLPGTWDSDADVTVRTMEPNECLDCELFRNMTPVGPVIEVLPSHKFSVGKEPLVSINISKATLVKGNVNPKNLKIYKLSVQEGNPILIPLETYRLAFLDTNLIDCEDTTKNSWAYVSITAKTSSFSEFTVLDSVKADSIVIEKSTSDEIVSFACTSMDSMWMDTLWMGTANGWLEYPYLCTGKSNYLLQLKSNDRIVAEHQGASTKPIVWHAKNSDLSKYDSVCYSTIVFYALDGKTEQKLGPMIIMDSVAPVIENVEIEVSENMEEKIIHVYAEVKEIGSKLKKITMELFYGGRLMESVTLPGDGTLQKDFRLKRKDLYECIGCKASVAVIVEDLGHNTDKVMKQTEKLYPYPSSLVLWYPLSEGVGNIGYEIMTKEEPKPLHLELSGILKPWGNKYGTTMSFAKDSASSRYRLPVLDSLTPFTFEFNYNAGNIQREDWSILSFIGMNEWTFGVGTYNRFFLKIGSEIFYFNTCREPNIPTHIAVVVDGQFVSLYKNGMFSEKIQLGKALYYGGNGRLSIGMRNGICSASGSISNLRFYSSALSESQIQNVFRGILDEESIHIETVRAIAITDREGMVVDHSCSAPGVSYLRQKNADNKGVMKWNVNLNADDYSLYLFHRNYLSEDSEVELFVNGTSKGIFKLSSTGNWKSEKLDKLNLALKSGDNEISIRPLGNLGIVALALASTSANIEANQISYNESSWTNPEAKTKVFMKYESVEDKKWAQIRFDLRNLTEESIQNAKIRYYYKGEGENVNAVAFYPSVPMRVVNDAGSVFYAEMALTESIAAYGTAYYNQGPLIGLHRLASPDNYFPYWDKTDDPSYIAIAESDYTEALGVALLDAEGNLLNEFSCYDDDGPMQKVKSKVRAMARDDEYNSTTASSITAYVENIGTVPVDGFEMRYYYRDNGETEVNVNWNAFAKYSNVAAGGDLYYISFVYDVLLNSGEKSDYGNGVQFTLHHKNWTNDFNAYDDPSHHNLNNGEMGEADSVVILDRLGNLIWGNPPQPKFNSNYKTKDMYANLIHKEGNVIYVKIEDSGYYILEVVNAFGVPLNTLYRGSWEIGEHSVEVDMKLLNPSCFLVLRKGTEIMSWTLLN